MHKTHHTTIDVNIDLNILLRNIYAESALHFAQQSVPKEMSPLLTADRKALALQLVSTAYTNMLSQISAYCTTHNFNNFASEEMLSLTLAYQCNSTHNTPSISNLILQAIIANVLAICYPSDMQYHNRQVKTCNALLSVLAYREQF